MARYSGSTFGKIKGRIGDDVAYTVGGQKVIRKHNDSPNDPKTESQVYQRDTLALVVGFFRKASPAINAGFVERKPIHSAYNLFTSLAIKEAVVDKTGTPEINYPNLRIAKGSLQPLTGCSVVKSGSNGFTITETSKSDGFTGFDTDKLNVLVVDPIKEEAVSILTVGERKQKTFTIFPPAALNTDKAQFFMFYTSADGKKASDSVHATVPAPPAG
jgi:hypothetical protein